MHLTAAVFAHPGVVATGLDLHGRADLATVFIKAFDTRGKKYLIDFDDVWDFCGYSTKSNGLRKLKGRVFKEGVDYECLKGRVLIQIDQNPPEPDENLDQGGRSADKYYLTERAFETFAMVALTEIGERVRDFLQAIRDAYVELMQRLQSGTDREQAYILTYDKKNCLYLAAILQQPQHLCKYIFTANIKERINTHKRTFAPPYFFELIHIVEANDLRKAEEIFQNFPDVKNNIQQLKIGDSVQREIFQMHETLTKKRLYHLMRKVRRQATSMDVIKSDVHDKTLDIEKEKMKQLELRVEQERIKVEQEKIKAKTAEWDHQYRMERLKRVNQGTLPVVPDLKREQASDTESVGDHDTTMIDQTEPVVVLAPIQVEGAPLHGPLQESTAYNQPLQSFIAAECKEGPQLVVHAGCFLKACNDYFIERLLIQPLTAKALKEDMEALGFFKVERVRHRGQTNQFTAFRGLRIKEGSKYRVGLFLG
jgi:hypothetical protein